MGLGIAIWIILIIVLLGGFKALAIIVGVMIIAFVSGLIMTENTKNKRDKQ